MALHLSRIGRTLPSAMLLGILLETAALNQAWGQPADTSRKRVLPDFDARDAAVLDEFTGVRQSQARAVTEHRRAAMQLYLAARSANPGARITPNRFGVPKVLLRDGRALTAPSTQQPEAIAKSFLRSQAAIFPFAGSEVDALRPLVSDAAGDAVFLAFNQTVNGIDVFNGQIKFTLSKAGEVVAVAAGDVTPGLSLSTTPRLSAEEAVRAAYGATGVEPPTALTPFLDPKGRAAFLNPAGNRFNPITADLVVFPLTSSSARLAYRVYLDIDAQRYYEILVGADDGRLLFRHNLYVYGSQGTVWRESPLVGSRQWVNWPPSDDPLRNPDPWLPSWPDGANGVGWVTAGNNTDSFLDYNEDGDPDAVNSPCMQNGRAYSATGDFTFAWGDGTVGSDPRLYPCASVANLFYFVNLAHDFYYSLGFTENAGNFQNDNYGRGGSDGDPILAGAQSDPDNSGFSPTPDGLPPHIWAGLYTHGTTSKGDDRDVAYNGQTIFHEYGHGVSTRLASAGTSASCLSQVQSGAMGEGWSDYFATSYFNRPVYGEYTSWNAVTGIRRQSYEGYTFTYEDIGNGSHGYEVHDDGEIWAAALWDLRKSLGQAITDRLVINGLKSGPCNPSMKEARDAILAADQASAGGKNNAAIWRVFAKHGLGYSARGADGDLWTGSLYDAGYNQPPDLQASQSPVITSDPLSIRAGIGDVYMYQITASNPNGGVLQYSLISGPTGMTVNSETGLVSWTPGRIYTGQRVKIAVTDGRGGRTVHGWALPVITSIEEGKPLVTSISGSIGSLGYAGIAVPAGAPVLQITLRDGTGDADLRVADPDGSVSHSMRDGNVETLSFANPEEGTWRIELRGYRGYSGVSLAAHVITPTPLNAGTILPGMSGVAGSETFYRVTVARGTAGLTVSTSGGTGNVDLYVRKDKPAACQMVDAYTALKQPCTYDLKSSNSGNSESIHIENPDPGEWYIDLSAYAAYSGVTLRVEIVDPTPQSPTITGYTWATPPLANQLFGGTITGTGFVAGISVGFCSGPVNCQQLTEPQMTLNGATSLSVRNVSLAAGTWAIYVKTSAGSSARSAPFVVLEEPVEKPAVTSYLWTPTPTPGQPFGGTIFGRGYIDGIAVWFCSSSLNCQRLLPSQVTLNGPTSLSVSNVVLAAGAWTIYVQTSAGPSELSAPFEVGLPWPPQITSYAWTNTPFADKPFSGTIYGTGFVPGTAVYFCPGTVNCQQMTASQVTLDNPYSLTVKNVSLPAGTWTFYVQNSVGPSARSTPFVVWPQPDMPKITGYAWTTTPRFGQPFSGTVYGTGFIPGIAVYFCLGAANCQQTPASQVTLNGPTSVSVKNVILAAGWWTIYVQTSAGPSARSTAFAVESGLSVSFSPNPVYLTNISQCTTTGGRGYLFTLVLTETSGVGLTPTGLTYSGRSDFIPDGFGQHMAPYSTRQFYLAWCRTTGGVSPWVISAIDDNGGAVIGSATLTMN